MSNTNADGQDLWFSISRQKATSCPAEALADVLDEGGNENIRCASELDHQVAELVSDSLRGNMVVTCLHLQYCNIDASLMETLVAGLVDNRRLEALSLGFNYMNEAAGGSLAWLVLSNHSLRYLDLSGTALGDVGVMLMMEGLAGNNGLGYLVLSYNGLTPECFPSIVDCLKQNSTLVYLDLTNNNLHECETQIGRMMVERMQYRRDVFYTALREETSFEWKKSKLMIVGEAQAGKTATVRSLLGRPFKPEWNSTAGIELSESRTANWSLDEDTDYTLEMATGVMLKATRVFNISSVHDPTETSHLFNEPEVFETVPHIINPEKGRVDPYSHHLWKQQVAQQDNWRRRWEKQLRREMGKDEVANAAEPVAHRKKNLYHQQKREEDYVFDENFIVKSLGSDSVKLAIWDYGGQNVFNTLHHIFLNECGVYLVVFSLADMMDQEKKAECSEYLRFWLRSIELHAPSAPVLILGTFLDGASPEDLTVAKEAITNTIKPGSQVASIDNLTFLPISNYSGEGIEVLQSEIQSTTEKQSFVHQKVPIRWMRLLDWLLKVNEKPWLQTGKFFPIAEEFRVTSILEMENMLSMFNELGAIIYINSSQFLGDTVVPQPQWLLDKICMVVRDPEEHRHKFENELGKAGLNEDLNQLYATGIASQELLHMLWQNEHAEYLIEMMQNLMLLSKGKFGNRAYQYLIPSMIPSTMKPSMNLDRIKGVKAEFRFNFLPHGVFERYICLCVNASIEDKSPVFERYRAMVWISKDCKILVERMRSKEALLVTIVKGKYAKQSLNLLEGMLQKIKEDVMGDAFTWETFVEVENVEEGLVSKQFVATQVAENRKLAPWYTEQEVEELGTGRRVKRNIARFFSELRLLRSASKRK